MSTTRVIWQNNPHINGAIDNTVGTWTYHQAANQAHWRQVA